MRYLLIFCAFVVFLSSCVSNKKFVYLQKDDVNVNGLLKDSVLRTYALDSFRYRIQPNDLISVQFQSLTQKDFDIFSGSLQNGSVNLGQPGGALLVGELVDEKGEIRFPVVGQVKVSGLDIFMIQDTLQAIAEKYLESPVVKVRLLNYRVTILGEVNREGSISITNNRVNYLEAMGLAGGLTDLADKANIKLIRQQGGETQIQYINLLDENFIQSPYYYVYQNDILIVPSLRQRPFRKYFGQNLALVVSSLTLLLLSINLLNTK